MIILGDLDDQIRLYYDEYNLEKWLHDRGVHKNMEYEVDWESIQTLSKTSQIKGKVIMMKTMHQQFPTAELLHRIKCTTSPTCLRCKNDQETANNFFQCGYIEAKRYQKEAIQGQFYMHMQIVDVQVCPNVWSTRRHILSVFNMLCGANKKSVMSTLSGA